MCKFSAAEPGQAEAARNQTYGGVTCRKPCWRCDGKSRSGGEKVTGGGKSGGKSKLGGGGSGFGGCGSGMGGGRAASLICAERVTFIESRTEGFRTREGGQRRLRGGNQRKNRTGENGKGKALSKVLYDPRFPMPFNSNSMKK